MSRRTKYFSRISRLLARSVFAVMMMVTIVATPFARVPIAHANLGDILSLNGVNGGDTIQDTDYNITANWDNEAQTCAYSYDTPGDAHSADGWTRVDCINGVSIAPPDSAGDHTLFIAEWLTSDYSGSGATFSANFTYEISSPGDTTSAPTVTTGDPSDETQESVTLAGSVTSDGGDTVVHEGFIFDTDSHGADFDSYPHIANADDESATSFTATAVPFLSCGTTYYYRAFAQNNTGIGLGDESSFTTSACDEGGGGGGGGGGPGPTVSIISPQDASNNGWHADIDWGDATTCYYEYGADGFTQLDSCDASLIPAPDSDGSYTLSVYATDADGNASDTVSSSFNYIADAAIGITGGASDISTSTAVLQGNGYGPHDGNLDHIGMKFATDAYWNANEHGYDSSAGIANIGGPSGEYGFTAYGLSCGTTYHYQAYAFNDSDGSLTGYGKDRTFTTSACPATLVGYWALNETSGTTAHDSSGNGNTGILQLGPSWDTGKFGGGLTLNGEGQIISVADASNIPVGNSPYTISAWFKSTTPSIGGFAGWGLYNTEDADVVNAFRFAGPGDCPNDNGLDNYWWGDDFIACAPDGVNLFDGDWHQVIAEYDGTERKMYIDGQLIGTNTPNNPNNVSDASNLTIGATDAFYGEFFNGTLDEVRIYNAALDDDEIAASYNSGDGGSVAPNILVSEPTDSESVATWAPSVDWGTSTACSYSYNNSDFIDVDCSHNGSDISPPVTSGDYTLYLKGVDGSSQEADTQVSFTYTSSGSWTLVTNDPFYTRDDGPTVGNGWLNPQSAWSIQGGKLVGGTSDPDGWQHNFLLRPDSENALNERVVTNYTNDNWYATDLNLTTATVLRYHDENNFYFAEVYDDSIKLYRYLNGSISPLETTYLSPNLDTASTLTEDASAVNDGSATDISVTVKNQDGVTLGTLSYSDTDAAALHTAGNSGLVIWGSNDNPGSPFYRYISSVQTYSGDAQAPDGEWSFNEGESGTCGDSADICDTSGNDDNGTNNGGVWAANPTTGAPAPNPYSMAFENGQNANGYDLHMQSRDFGDTFTLSAWVKPHDLANIGTIMGNAGGGGTNGFKFYINTYNTTDGRLLFETGNGTDSDVSAESTAGAITDDTWQLVTAVVNKTAGTAELYVNGTDVTESDTIRTDFNTSSVWTIGSMQGDWLMTGQIDDLRTYNSDLSDAQVQGLMNNWTAPDGSSDHPLHISTCDDLNAVNDNLSTDYELETDLDCSSDGNTIIVGTGSDAPFTGSFDGNGHRITIDESDVENYGGLFGYASGSSIHDLSVAGSVTGGGYLGGVVGHATNATLARVKSTVNVSGSGSGANNIGGLVGAGYSTEIDDSYSSGTISGRSDVGGLMGTSFGSLISHSYFSGSVSGLNDAVGGIEGYYTDGGIENSFVAGAVWGTASNTGALVGYLYSDTNHDIAFDFWDVVGSGQTAAVGSDPTGDYDVTGVNDDGNDPDYFKNNSWNEPFTDGGWDFDTVWQAINGAYPELEEFVSEDVILPSVSISSPGWEEIVFSWAPSIVWDTATTCSYKYDDDADYTNLDSCDSPIPAPETIGEHTLYIRGTNTAGSNESYDTFDYEAGQHGSPDDPIHINSCSDFEDMGSHLGFYYVLDNDLACTTEGNSMVIGSNSDPFTGSFEGNGHKITVSIDESGSFNVGLFSVMNHATTTDLWVDGTVIGGSNTGGLAGRIENGTIIERVKSTADVQANGNGYVGGIVGHAQGSSYIQDSYATGNVSGWYPVGGIVGQVDESVILRNYFAGSVTSNAGADGNNVNHSGGGIVGIFDNSVVHDNFNAGTVSSPDASGDGGIIGYNAFGSNIINNYWDSTASGVTDCVGTGPEGSFSGCSDVNPDGDSGDYFKGNDSADPFGAWDFTDTWAVVDGAYPDLQIFLNPVPPPHVFSGEGEGTSESPYLITSCSQLQEMKYIPDADYRLSPTEGHTIDCSATQTENNIDVTGETLYTTFIGTGDYEYDMGARHIRNDAPVTIYINDEVQDPSTYDVDYDAGTVNFHDDPGEGSVITADYSYYQGFEPIGTFSIEGGPINLFTGTLDGNGVTISGLYVNHPDLAAVGLFGGLEGSVSDLTFDDSYVSGQYFVGTLAGLAGGEVGSTTITNIAVTEGSMVTAVAPLEFGFPVLGAGGLVGVSNTNISHSSSAANVDGFFVVGGLLGTNFGGSISASYATGDVSGVVGVGGFIGYNEAGDISDSYARGSVTGYEAVGGFAGENGASLSKVYSTGAVTVYASTGGGLVGGNDDAATVDNSFWDADAQGEAAESLDNGAGTPKTMAQMKDSATFTDTETSEGLDSAWNFDDIWAIDSINNSGYPYLAWQTASTTVSYEIYTCRDLQAMANDPSGNYTLMQDIACGPDAEDSADDTTQWNSDGEGGYYGFVPVGYGNPFEGDHTHVFTGTFNGNGHTISGLYINRPENSWFDHETGTGLFGVMLNASTTNLTLQDITVVGGDTTGGLAGLAESSTFDSVAVTGESTVTGTDDGIGGLIGAAMDGEISNSYAEATVTAPDAIEVGGLVGYSFDDIQNSYATGAVTGTTEVGGLVGNNDGADIDASYAAGAVTGTTGLIGGFVGMNLGHITNAYALGSVTGGTIDSGTGGFAGTNGAEEANGSITNAYSIGGVSYNSTGDNDQYASGFVGENFDTIIASFWNIETGGGVSGCGSLSANCSGLTAVDTASLKDIATYTTGLGDATWNFADTWAIDSSNNSGYPYFAWQTFTVSDPFDGGTGSIDDPYQISTCQQLQSMANYLDQHFVLTQNVECGSAAENSEDNTALWHNTVSTDIVIGYGDGEQKTFPIGVQNIREDAAFSVSGDTGDGPVEKDNYTVDYATGEITFDEAPASGEELTADFSFYGGFDPIGNTEDNFTGTLDASDGHGGEYAINGLYINRPYDDNIGLFGNLSEGSVSNLDITDANVSGHVRVGIVTGQLLNATMSNVHTTGAVAIANEMAGGLAGENTGSITESSFVGTITSLLPYGDTVGGLVGFLDPDAEIINSYADAVATLYGYFDVGGLVGEDYGTIYNSHASSTLSADDGIGGLAGYMADSSSITRSYASGTIIEDQSYRDGNEIGGLVGTLDGGVLEDDYTRVTLDVGLPTRGVGGLVGEFRNGGSITNTYAVGIIDADMQTVTGETCADWEGNVCVPGGLIGVNDETGSVEDSFWNADISGLTDETNGGSSETTAQMKTLSTFTDAGWDFDGIWAMTASYPYLQWQTEWIDDTTPTSYTLTYMAGAHGTISGPANQTITSGDSGTAVTAVADDGYHFVAWSDDVTSNPRTDMNVTHDVSVTASFALNTVSGSGGGGGGSGHPSGSVSTNVRPATPAANLPTVESCSFTRNISLGMNGSDVRQLQVFLNTHGYTLATSGAGSPGNETTYFGPATRKALAEYQAAQGISISQGQGVFGPRTMSFICGERMQSQSTTQSKDVPSFVFTRDLYMNMSGGDVAVIQQYLIAQGYAIPAGATGYFGAQTKIALMTFQRDNHIVPTTGYFGPITRAFIMGLKK